VLTKGVGPPGSAKPVGRIIEAAKTEDGVRTMTMRAWVHEELHEWRARLRGEGLPGGDEDLIIPGAVPDGHYTLEQQHNFIRDIKACGCVAAARDPDISFLQKLTPYSLRRGHISLRVLAGEDIRRIADECGTSAAMIHRRYLHELDVRHELPDDFIFVPRRISLPPSSAWSRARTLYRAACLMSTLTPPPTPGCAVTSRG
jgi:hypothetical protein